MSLNEENLIFSLENKKTNSTIYQFESNLLEFHREMLKNEKLSFFYTFKDAANELEENLNHSLPVNRNSKTILRVKFLDKILHECDLDICNLDETNITKHEIILYFIFEKVSKNVLVKITEEHKNFILSNNGK